MTEDQKQRVRACRNEIHAALCKIAIVDSELLDFEQDDADDLGYAIGKLNQAVEALDNRI